MSSPALTELFEIYARVAILSASVPAVNELLLDVGSFGINVSMTLKRMLLLPNPIELKASVIPTLTPLDLINASRSASIDVFPSAVTTTSPPAETAASLMYAIELVSTWFVEIVTPIANDEPFSTNPPPLDVTSTVMFALKSASSSAYTVISPVVAVRSTPSEYARVFPCIVFRDTVTPTAVDSELPGPMLTQSDIVPTTSS